MLSLKNYSHYSLTKAISHPDKLVKKHKELGFTHLAITDYDSISGAIEIIKESDKAGIQWIIGTTLSINGEHGSITLLAQNETGWKSLIKIVSGANQKDNFRDHPQISLENIKLLDPKGLICIVGGVDSIINSRIFNANLIDEKYLDNMEQLKASVNKNWGIDCQELLQTLLKIFGKNNLYLETCLESLPIDQLFNQAVRYLGKLHNVPVVPTIGSHYINQEDWKDHHILLCSGLKTTLKGIKDKLVSNIRLNRYFQSSNYFVRSPENLFPKNELDNLEQMKTRFEKYSVLGNPRLPKFECPGGKTAEEYTRELCRIGWKQRQDKLIKDKVADYKSRVDEELATYAKVNILDYFLIVADFLEAAKKRGEYIGLGRGSVGGCAIAYFLGITQTDPVRYNLSSSRFYNAGRNTATKIALPDIDCDLMVEQREKSIEYLKNKYGASRIGQVVTYGRLQGRGALREVLRLNDACTFDEINKITEFIPDEAKIADDLQDMKEAGEEKSIILWSLRNNREQLKNWCYLDENEQFQGEYSKLFEQAVRLEGTLKTQGRHAAAIILGEDNLNNFCPMLFNKSKEDPICGFEYESLESIGLVKFDLLGVSVLDKLFKIKELIKERHGKQ